MVPGEGRAAFGQSNPKKDPTMNDLTNPSDQAARIRTLNDLLRQHFHTDPAKVPGAFKVLLTPALQNLSTVSLGQLLDKVAGFTAFDEGNDPHREHDFGAVEHENARYFWKIDYYDRQLKFASHDAADPNVTVRVLTVMHASEY